LNATQERTIFQTSVYMNCFLDAFKTV